MPALEAQKKENENLNEVQFEFDHSNPYITSLRSSIAAWPCSLISYLACMVLHASYHNSCSKFEIGHMCWKCPNEVSVMNTCRVMAVMPLRHITYLTIL